VRRHQADFEMIVKMEWSADGRWLLALEEYGRWRLLCLDAATGESRPRWPEFADMTRTDFALDSDSKRLAILHRGHIALHDFTDMRKFDAFPSIMWSVPRILHGRETMPFRYAPTMDAFPHMRSDPA
jgi:hypothetical protein